ncbi:GAF sensor hybrid histidine kinase [[Leptolyngbya] sp. PCC 7376]|uniref:hybrid sensor histidine kinase/response regulator n=1 Tax=[Leptolyngbya] sp. PCC 7376 TaxID=111781 RepID=UPI00029F0656|nr:GAF domain-containing protein [[Leptolyngbya] sp. PCC 7376]AFY39394.1 GAF sensor hybrid histidine kinase [[Leptolyngbya] sp. PCC 7376]
MAPQDIIQEQLNIIQEQLAKEKLLRQVGQLMSQSLDIDFILKKVCKEIRKFIKADRVGIFKFEENSNYCAGAFMAESKIETLDSVIELRIEDHCFGEHYASHYFQGKCFALDDIYNNDLLDCHIKILERFQVRANLVVPIQNQGNLWGLLCVHQCSSPRQWHNADIDVIQQLANHCVVIIERATLFNQLKAEVHQLKQAEVVINRQAQREKLSREISQRISQHLDLQTIFDTACGEIRDFLQVDRVCIFQFIPESNFDDGIFVSESIAENIKSVLEKRVHDHSFGENYATHYLQGKYLAIEDIYEPGVSQCHIDILEQFQIRANLVFPLSLKDCLWGLLCVHQCNATRHWEKSELDLTQQLSISLAIAIQQAELFERLQTELVQRQEAQKALSQRNEELAITNLELERATRLKDEFLANMSHELRTPLNTILGMMQALGEEIFGPLNKEQLKSIRTTERNGHHLLELINEILDLAKVESGTLKLDCKPTKIVNLCQFSLSVVAQQAQEKGIHLESKLPYTIPELILDERRIKQVLINLLTNAIKFTPKGGNVSLEVKHYMLTSNIESNTRDIIEFIVTDTGIGIDQNFLNKLFQPFTQIDSALNRQYAGTGLGLALAKRIVKLHKGKVGVTSEVGKGSCFIIELPCIKASNTIEKNKDQINNDQYEIISLKEAQSQPLILVVEDNPDNVVLIKSYLIAKGYRIIVAEDGKKGIDTALSRSPDLILMDIQMPDMDGFEAIGRMREHPELTNIPIIALTALAMKGDKKKCIQAGANEYLGKPINLRQLVKIMAELLDD